MKHRLPLTVLFAAALSISSATATSRKQTQAEHDYNAAAGLHKAGSHQRASSAWSSFIKQFPNDRRVAHANYFLGVCRLRTRQFDKAAKQFRTVRDRWPNLDRADKVQFNLGMAFYGKAIAEKNADKYREAAKEFALYVGMDAQGEFADDALFLQSSCLISAGEIESALEPLNRLIRKQGTSRHVASGFYELGTAQQKLGRHDEAVKTFKEFLSKPGFRSHELVAAIRMGLGDSFFVEGKLKEAIEQFGMAANDQDFKLADYALYRKLQMQLKDGQLKQAAETLEDFDKKFPESDYRNNAKTLTGKAFWFDGNYSEVVRILTPVAKGLEPPAGEAAFWLGRALIKQQQCSRALSQIESAIERLPTDPFLSDLKFARIEAIYGINSRRREAASLYERFMKDYPNHEYAARANYMAAHAAFAEQSYAKSRELAQAFLANPKYNDPKSTDARLVPEVMFLAAESTLMESGAESDYKDAEKLFRSVILKFPDHERVSECQMRVGWCLNAAKKSQETIDWLRPQLSHFDKKQLLPRALLAIGQSHQRLNQHHDAVTTYEQIISQNRDWNRLDEALSDAATSYRELEDWPKARTCLERVVHDFPKSRLRAQSTMFLGIVLQQQGDNDAAIKWYRQTAEQYAESGFGSPAMLALVELHSSRKEWGEARDWSTRLIDGKASEELKIRSRYIRAAAYQSLKDFPKAIADFAAVRATSKDKEETDNSLYGLVLCHLGDSQIQQARDRLEELTTASPGYDLLDNAYIEMARATQANPRTKSVAIESYKWIITNRPKSRLATESAFRFAQHLVELTDSSDDQVKKMQSLAEAERVLRAGLAVTQMDEQKAPVLYLLSNVHYRQTEYGKAARTFTQYVEKYPGGQYRVQATSMAAHSHYQVGEYELAMAMFDKIANVDFKDAADEEVRQYHSQSLYYAADCATRLGRWKECQLRYTRLIDQHANYPQRGEAMYGIGVAQQQQGQADAAIATFERVTQEYETETAAMAKYMVGVIHFDNKRYEDAIEQLSVVTVDYPYENWQAIARYQTARCFDALGDKARAMKTLNELLEKHPKHARAKDAMRMLEKLDTQ